MRWFGVVLFLTLAQAGDDIPVGTNPGAIESTGKAVSQKTPLRIGQILQVKWGNTWWAAKVVALKENGTVKITYVGWHKSSDEWVPRKRLQLDANAVKKAKRALQKKKPLVRKLPPPPVPPLQRNPGPVKPSGDRVRPDSPLDVGLLVMVESGGAWWGAKIIALRWDGRVKITYVGWAKSFDEWVSRERLQFDSNPPRVIEHRAR